MASRKDNYYLLSLGCSKNTVDSESIAQVLNQNGMHGVGSPDKASVLIVNTCGFIDTAKQESIDALRELVEGRRSGQMVIAAGCLAQRYGGTQIVLSVQCTAQNVIWHVMDNGPGIPEPLREEVFAAFHRLSDSIDGAGIGLTIVARIVRLHTARIWLGSAQHGTGLAVHIEFPRASIAQ